MSGVQKGNVAKELAIIVLLALGLVKVLELHLIQEPQMAQLPAEQLEHRAVEQAELHWLAVAQFAPVS